MPPEPFGLAEKFSPLFWLPQQEPSCFSSPIEFGAESSRCLEPFSSAPPPALGASAAIEAALSIEGMNQGIVLPTVNHIPDPEFEDIDVVPNQTRKHSFDFFLSNAFGFGGINCCIVFKGV